MRMIYAIIFSLLAIVAGAGYSAAHVIPGSPPQIFPHPEGDQRADSIDPMDEAEVRALAAHWGYHLVSAVGLRGAQDLVDFRRRALSDEDRGTWTSDEMSMNLLDTEGDVIYSFQPYNEKLQSYGIEGRSIRNYTDANGEDVLDNLSEVHALRQQGPFPDPTHQLTPDELRNYRFIDYVDCVAYSPTADESRHMCFYLVNNAFHVVAGLDIEPEHLPEVEESAHADPLREKGATAQDVLENGDRKTLKEFVDTVASIYANLIIKGPTGLAEIIKLQIEHQKISSPWRAGNIYLFIMTMTDQEGSVLFNALDRSLEGASLNVTDQEGNNIWQLIQETLAQEVKGEGFFEYLWDDPDDPNDDVRGPDGLPIEGQTPGTSRKIGYVKTVDFSAVGLGTLIIGSGIYPEGGGDDGCSISGPGTGLGSGLLNLFLIVSVLLSAVSWKNRINRGRAKRMG